MKLRKFCAAGAALPLLFLLNTGCKQDELPGEVGVPYERIGSVRTSPGFGNQEGPPTGTPFELPKGLKLVSRDNHPFDPAIEKLFGNMNTFYVDINLVADDTWEGGEVIFPPGLVMLNITSSRIQNGMLMGRVRIHVPAHEKGAGEDTTTVYIGVACMNASMGFPWEDNFDADTREYPIGKGMYRPSVVTTEPEVLKFLSLLEDRPHLNLTKHHNPWDALDEGYVEPEWMKPYNAIQLKFWKMTDGDGLTRGDLEELIRALGKS